MRSIVHFYMPSFHAAIEQLRKPELAGRPVIVTHRSGGAEFVVSASTEAKAEGVREGMTARHASRHCPNGAFVPADWGAYKEASDRALDILSGYSPRLEPHGFDRAYMAGEVKSGELRVESGECGVRSVEGVVAEVQHRVKDEAGLVMSAGIAQNKLVAHAAASVCKPGESLEIEPGTECEFLAPLPVAHLPGVGPKIEKRLLALGVVTIGELASIPCSMLARQFGTVGSRLHKLAHGIDFSSVNALYPPDIIIIEHTFDSISDAPSEPDEAQERLLRMTDRVSAELSKRDQKTGCVSLRLEFDDRNVRMRSYVPKNPISSVHEIYSAARRILRQEMHGARIVSMKLTLSDLRAFGGFQLNFLEDTERKMRLQALLGNIRARFGEQAIMYGGAFAA